MPLDISISTRQAIRRGLRQIALPARAILFSSLALCIVLLVWDFSWWHFLLLPGGIALSALHTAWATPRWRIWAYERVADIHQLQRSAELAGLLARKSHDKTRGLMGMRQRDVLKELQRRFLEEPGFIDDTSIPQETPVYAHTLYFRPDQPEFIISDAGILVLYEGTVTWDQVENERIARVSYSSSHHDNDSDAPGGGKDFFRFECHKGRFEMPISSLDITAWELDLLLYIYRGRFTEKQKESRPQQQPIRAQLH